MAAEENSPFLSHVEPVLAVSDVIQTVDYWHDVLGFTNKWTWGEPPNHGGVTWQGVFVQFSLNSTLASSSKGNSIFIRVKNLQLLYQFHQDKNVEIVEPLENKPWGMAGYTVREINGYYIIFAGVVINERKKSEITRPAVQIISRVPTASEYLELIEAVGWEKYKNHSFVEKILAAPLFAVVAEDELTNKVIGCALLLGDDASFYYLKDIMVHPAWQNKHIGSMLMNGITNWLDIHAPEHAFVCLITGEQLAPFYRQFDFVPVFGMHRSINRKKTE